MINDPVTGVQLTFLTTTASGDSKINQTHNQWTSDGKWVIFRSGRVKNEAFAVNEESGEIVQVSEGGYSGMLNVARNSMNSYFMRRHRTETSERVMQIIEVILEKLFTDSEARNLQLESEYQRICGTAPADWQAGGDRALDGDENWVYFRVGKDKAMQHLPKETKMEENFGPRNMGAGP